MKALALHNVKAVVIGASAGGIEVLAGILPALPARVNAAVFIVLHLPKDKPSLLPSIFTAQCAVAVREPVHGEQVKAGTIYFGPPDYHLLLDAGPCIALSIDAPVNYSRPSIDVLFEAAADLYGPQLLALLLSGGNDDGVYGLQHVQRCGGRVVVQHPATARMPQMPLAALAQLEPDAVLSVAEMAALLQSLPLRTVHDD